MQCSMLLLPDTVCKRRAALAPMHRVPCCSHSSQDTCRTLGSDLAYRVSAPRAPVRQRRPIACRTPRTCAPNITVPCHVVRQDEVYSSSFAAAAYLKTIAFKQKVSWTPSRTADMQTHACVECLHVALAPQRIVERAVRQSGAVSRAGCR